MEILKWVAIAIVAVLAFNWLKRGAGASVNMQTFDGSWTGNGMIYGPGSAYLNAYRYARVPSYVGYSPDSGLSVQVGF